MAVFALLATQPKSSGSSVGLGRSSSHDRVLKYPRRFSDRMTPGVIQRARVRARRCEVEARRYLAIPARSFRICLNDPTALGSSLDMVDK